MEHIKRTTTKMQSVVSVLLWVFLSEHHASGVTVVEGYDGGSVILPCTLTPNGDLTWKQRTNLILIKPARGAVIIAGDLWKGGVSLVNSADLRISPLRRNRDGDHGSGYQVFECEYTGGGKQRIQLILLARITDVTIPEVIDGRVTAAAGFPLTVTCSVTGDPNPPPSYSWSVNDVTVSGQTLNSYRFTPDKSMKTTKCTAINRYRNGSVLSVKKATATLNVQYLDPAKSSDSVIVTENGKATLQCSVEGNPPPSYEWRRSGRSEVRSTSADYTIENVHRSAAGEYTCRYKNTIGSNIIAAKLIVQYPPNVRVSYDKTTQTLSCTAEGVPRNYNFSQWEHRLDGKLLQTLETQSSGSTATLKLPGTLTYEDTGCYVCQASNGIKSPQRGQVLVTPQSPAIFENQSLLLTLTEGQTGSISVPFYTYSDTPNVKVVWKKSRESTLLTFHREETGPIRLPIHGQSVSIQGTVTILALGDVTQSDEGNYTLSVTNDINDVPQSNQITISVSVTSPGNLGNGTIGAAVGGGIAVVVSIIIVMVAVVLFRKYRYSEWGYIVQRSTTEPRRAGMNSEETVRNTGDQIAATYQNVPQEGTVYQGLAINPDYVNTTENQSYATLAGKGREATDYEQCDVPVNETNDVVADSVPNVAQYEDVSFPIQGGIPEYIDVCHEETENIEYENKALEKENSGTYYNL